jgi:hypothetical protein
MLLPVGTLYHGTSKHHSVGKVQDVLAHIFTSTGSTGNGTGLLAKARQTRLIPAVATAWLTADSFCHVAASICANSSLTSREIGSIAMHFLREEEALGIEQKNGSTFEIDST